MVPLKVMANMNWFKVMVILQAGPEVLQYMDLELTRQIFQREDAEVTLFHNIVKSLSEWGGVFEKYRYE